MAATTVTSTATQPAATAAPKLLLVGNPNVGKSVIFGYLTGKYVTVSNYPGTTVEVSRGAMRYGGADWQVIDTPGVNSLVPQSDDERVTRDLLISAQPDLIVQVADAKNLRRTLLITSQLVEFQKPMILVLNLMDEARDRNLEIDAKGISELYGIPVIETVAIDGEGLDQLHKLLGRASIPNDPLKAQREHFLSEEKTGSLPAALTIEWLQTRDPELRQAVEEALDSNREFSAEERVQMRRTAGKLESLRQEFLDEVVAKYKKTIPTITSEVKTDRVLQIAIAFLLLGFGYFLFTEATRLSNAILRTSIPSLFDVVNNWLNASVLPVLQPKLGVVGEILFGQKNNASGAYENGLLHPFLAQLIFLVLPVMVPLAFVITRSKNFADKLGRWTREARTGIPLLLVVLLLMFEFVGVIGAGTFVDFFETTLFNNHLNPFLQRIIPPGFIYDFFIGKYGLVSMGLTYALAIVLPIVTTFFIAFGLLEDSGYLPRLAILSDRIFRFMGLNGKAVLPMVLGLGCDTMATMTTRILATKKERVIATLLLALGVPCSAQLGVILGISASLSFGAVLTIFGVVLSQMMLVGYLSSKLIRGERGDFIFEIPPIRIPQLWNVWTKTWIRLKWYVKEALPLFVLGTVILFILDRLKIPTPWGTQSGLDVIESALSPVVQGVLHLPKQAAQVLLLGFLRRDYGAAGLFAMVEAKTMDSVQIVVALITLTLFIPCVANFFMMIREHGVKKAMYMLAFITPFAIAVGGAVSWILRALNIHF